MTLPFIKGDKIGFAIFPMIFDGTEWVAILGDSAGHLQVDVLTLPGINEYDNILFGYNDRLADFESQASTNGTTDANSTTCPSGEIWVVTTASCRHNDPTARRLEIQFYDGAQSIPLKVEANVDQWVTISAPGPLVLKAGDYIIGRAISLGSGRTVYVMLNGYKMKVA